MKKADTKTERILKLILFLNGPFAKSKDECCDFLNIKPSAFYAYLNILKNCGFMVVQQMGYYHIDAENSQNRFLVELFHIDEEEAYILSKAILNLDISLRKAALIKQKFMKLMDTENALDALVGKQQSEIVKKLHQSVRQKKQVIFKAYASGHSKTIKDRYVEPFEFKDGLELIWAFDLERSTNRQFKVCRIEDVIITNLSWQCEDNHRSRPVDIFRNTGVMDKEVSFEMDLLPRNLLIEEYPLSEKCIIKISNNRYILETKVAKYEGPARFILGLAENIKVNGSKGFITFLEKKRYFLSKIFFTPQIADRS